MLREWVERSADITFEQKVNILVADENNELEPLIQIPILCIGPAENEDSETECIENPLLVAQEGPDNVVINNRLSERQTKDIKTLLHMFEDVLTDMPGKTSLLEHDVKLTSHIPVSRKAYILPYAMREKVQKEIQDMIEAGIAEKSSSPYASPIVVVLRKTIQ